MLEEKSVHAVFEISLILKGAFALAEIGASILAYFVTAKFLVDVVHAITQTELTEDPRDLIANFLFRGAQHLSVSDLNFTAVYLMAHGVVKLWLIIGLWQKKPAYYPTAMVVFSLFIGYQLYRYSFTHSITLLLITVVDAFVIGMTWLEYRQLRRLA